MRTAQDPSWDRTKAGQLKTSSCRQLFGNGYANRMLRSFQIAQTSVTIRKARDGIADTKRRLGIPKRVAGVLPMPTLASDPTTCKTCDSTHGDCGCQCEACIEQRIVNGVLASIELGGEGE